MPSASLYETYFVSTGMLLSNFILIYFPRAIMAVPIFFLSCFDLTTEIEKGMCFAIHHFTELI
jgi:hypothetical protein